MKDKGEFRVNEEFKRRAENIVNRLYPKYSSLAHFYRSAVVRLVREEEDKLK